jgi:hypothetical protein
MSLPGFSAEVALADVDPLTCQQECRADCRHHCASAWNPDACYEDCFDPCVDACLRPYTPPTPERLTRCAFVCAP